MLAAPTAPLRATLLAGAALLAGMMACRVPAEEPTTPVPSEIPAPPEPLDGAHEQQAGAGAGLGSGLPAQPPAGAGEQPTAAPAEAVSTEAVSTEPVPTEPVSPEEGARLEAEAALERGDVRGAREALDALVTRPHLEAAGTALRAGRLDDALAEAEAAVELAPSHTTSLVLCGSLLVAVSGRTGETQRLTEALAVLRRADDYGPALARAARVALRLERADDALELARRGANQLPDPRWAEAEALASLAWPAQAPERTLAESALQVWRRRGGADAPEAQGLFEEAEEALVVLLARQPLDSWVWLSLGEAYLEARRPTEARKVVERGLDRVPGEEQLYELLARAARAEGGSSRVVAVFERQQDRRPRQALAWWYPALERFREGLNGGPRARVEFGRSEALFRACRRRSSDLEEACLRYEALCRTGQGWAWLSVGDLTRADRRFRAAEELVPGGLDQRVEGRLASAAEGLRYVLGRHLEEGAPALAQAAELAAYLWRSSPRDEGQARQAARLQRDLGDRLQLESTDFRSAQNRRLDDEQRLEQLRAQIGVVRPGDDLRGTPREEDLFREAGKERARQAREAYETSLEALRAVVELVPGDLRTRCDAAALAVQRLGAELEWAEEQLLYCVEVGGQRVAEGGLEGEELFALLETWGDAHQLLGELEFEHRDDPRSARPWFQRSLEIGPLPRPEVSEHYLPRCLPGGE